MFCTVRDYFFWSDIYQINSMQELVFIESVVGSGVYYTVSQKKCANFGRERTKDRLSELSRHHTTFCTRQSLCPRAAEQNPSPFSTTSSY